VSTQRIVGSVIHELLPVFRVRAGQARTGHAVTILCVHGDAPFGRQSKQHSEHGGGEIDMCFAIIFAKSGAVSLSEISMSALND